MTKHQPQVIYMQIWAMPHKKASTTRIRSSQYHITKDQQQEIDKGNTTS
jgi:hypothetical protein